MAEPFSVWYLCIPDIAVAVHVADVKIAPVANKQLHLIVGSSANVAGLVNFFIVYHEIVKALIIRVLVHSLLLFLDLNFGALILRVRDVPLENAQKFCPAEWAEVGDLCPVDNALDAELVAAL